MGVNKRKHNTTKSNSKAPSEQMHREVMQICKEFEAKITGFGGRRGVKYMYHNSSFGSYKKILDMIVVNYDNGNMMFRVNLECESIQYPIEINYKYGNESIKNIMYINKPHE